MLLADVGSRMGCMSMPWSMAGGVGSSADLGLHILGSSMEVQGLWALAEGDWLELEVWRRWARNLDQG